MPPLRRLFPLLTSLCLLVLSTSAAGAGPARASVPAPAPAAGSLQNAAPSEALTKLQALLRIDTTNPPGNEAAAAQLIASWLRAEGIEPTLYAPAPGRLNLVARLKGSGAREPLMLLNHLDVVTAEPASWTVPPFAGIVRDGALWGRGAFDMKGLGVMELVAFLELKRRGVALDRDVIFCAVADEEAGGEHGAQWLLRHHPEAVRCSELLNEGGSGLETPSGTPVIGIQTAERGLLWLRATAHGAPGHGSQDRPDGATRRLLRALAKLEAAPRRTELIPETARMFSALAGTERGVTGLALQGLAQPWLFPLLQGRAVAAEPGLATLVGDTLNVTVLQAGDKVNVMPGSASAEIDMRLLPGHSVAESLARVKQALGDDGIEVQVLHANEPTRSRSDGALYDALKAACEGEYPGALVTPVLTPGGGTDSAFFRQAGIQALGLMPIIASKTQLQAMHGNDEFITLEQLERGTRVVTEAVARAASAAAPARR